MEGFREVFSDWELRLYVILSLALQILPTVWAYYRRQITSHPFQRILWLLAFLAADFVATLSLGAIFHHMINPKSTIGSPKNKYLLALWAPFILLHLGKHSRITTFILADNEVWLSHFIRFIYHELTALYICYLASTETRVQFTSIILFLTGTIKFAERIIAIKRGSLNELRISLFNQTDPGFSFGDLEERANMNNMANIQGKLGVAVIPINYVEDEPLVASEDVDVRRLCAAYHSFNKHKVAYIDHHGMHGDREYEGDNSFRQIDRDHALKVIEVELGFAYDLFYTKTACFPPIWGWIVRLVILIFIFSALISFSCIDKQEYLKPDVLITYILLVVALILEMVSFFEAMISNRTKVQIGLWAGQKWRRVENQIKKVCKLMESLGDTIFQRTFAVMGQFNMLSYCFGDCKAWFFVKWVLDTFELKELWKNYHYTKYIPIDNHMQLKNRIFHQVRRRLQREANPLSINSPITLELLNEIPNTDVVQRNLDNDQFEQRLLVWHFATDLWYRTAAVDEDPCLDNGAGLAEDTILSKDAKHLSEYMMYLLAIHPSMLSSVTTVELQSYRNAYASCVQLYEEYCRIINNGEEFHQRLEEAYILFHRLIQQEDRDLRNTLLWDSFELALELRRLAAETNIRLWEFLFGVWVDMLSFAAVKTRGKEHAERLGTGGEFITDIWLFRLHWSLGSRYQL